MLKIRFKRSAKKELFDLDDDAFVRVVKAILDLQVNPRPRGYDVVAGKEDQLRIWVGRDYRVLYEVQEKEGKLVIIGIRRKNERTYK